VEGLENATTPAVHVLAHGGEASPRSVSQPSLLATVRGPAVHDDRDEPQHQDDEHPDLPGVPKGR